jgi:hypothetical protein
VELNERICRAILRNAWDRAAADEDEGAMPPFPTNVHPAYKSYTVERRLVEGGMFEKRTPCMKPAWTEEAFYREYLRKVIDAAPWDWLE